MNEEKVNQIKNALRALVSQIISSEEEPPEEIQDMLLTAIQHVATRIQELRSQGEQAGIEGLQPEPPHPPIAQGMPSSNVEGFAYDKDSGRLFVRFLGDYPNRNGPVYQYENVPAYVFDIFRRGAIPAKTDGRNRWGEWWKGKYPSLGAAMYHLIRASGFPYQRVA